MKDAPEEGTVKWMRETHGDYKDSRPICAFCEEHFDPAKEGEVYPKEWTQVCVFPMYQEDGTRKLTEVPTVFNMDGPVTDSEGRKFCHSACQRRFNRGEKRDPKHGELVVSKPKSFAAELETAADEEAADLHAAIGAD